MKFRFVSTAAKGFQWKLHRQSKAGFPSEHSAAVDLAAVLGVQLKHLRKDFKGSVPAPELPANLADKGILWHGAKLGWFIRSKRIYHLKPGSLVKDVKKKPSALKRKKVAGAGVLRLFKGVTYSKQMSAWLAQAPDTTGVVRQIGGLFQSQNDAASHLAQHLGVDVSELKKSNKQLFQRREPLLQHFKAVMAIYSAVPLQSQLPGDLSDTVQHAVADKVNLTAAARALVIQMKYGPYRQVVREEFMKHKAMSKAFFLACLRGFAKIPDATLAPWRLNVARHVAHHHGMIPTLMNLGVLRKETSSSKGGKRGQELTVDGTCVCKIEGWHVPGEAAFPFHGRARNDVRILLGPCS